MSTVTPSNDFVDTQPEVQSSRIMSPPELTEQETKAMEEQQRRLKYFSDTTNAELQQQQEQEIFYNLSLATILKKLSTTIISIINDLLAMTSQTTASDMVYIFVREDRLIYLGLLFVMIALAVYIIDITS
uniref:Uncharacterized protein n=1 Tax=viral metagenome TaxID=1070528 RepID=A0A6C0BJZ3_9ZZZZ